jgi:hypothetical protein
MVFFKPAGGDIQPRGIVSLPGYATEAECKFAGVAAANNKIPFLDTQVHFMCIPGPKKS